MDKRFIWLIVFVWILPKTGCAQKDSVQAVVKSPMAAMIRSAVFPGWGQWYNGKKWKTALILGAELGLGGNAMYMNQKMHRAVSSEEFRFYQDKRNLTLWWLAGLYFLNLLDAYVDAQLGDFDVSPELSIQDNRMVFSVCMRW